MWNCNVRSKIILTKIVSSSNGDSVRSSCGVGLGDKLEEE